MGVIFAFTIVPTHIGRFRNPHSFHINVVPLGYSFTCFLQDPLQHPHITAFCLRNTLGNLVLFVPLGILLPMVSRRFRMLKRVLLFALILSVSIEAIQFFLRFVGNPRSVDIDDVILNTLGACLGLACYRFFIASVSKTGVGEIVEHSAAAREDISTEQSTENKLSGTD
jgi:glycopeptide antibiotics resistance protein